MGEARQQVYKIRSYENTFMILKNKFGTFLTKEYMSTISINIKNTIVTPDQKINKI